ncbi:MAG TPA: hypothetical protein VFQ44_05410 [Streptosporangiaceae bacterium]|nr:hypothetical protein [Streptosporangiaceae bacterium]
MTSAITQDDTAAAAEALRLAAAGPAAGGAEAMLAAGYALGGAEAACDRAARR